MAGGILSVLNATAHASADKVVHTYLELRNPDPASLVAFNRLTLPVKLHTSTCQTLGLTLVDLLYIRSAGVKNPPALGMFLFLPGLGCRSNSESGALID